MSVAAVGKDKKNRVEQNQKVKNKELTKWNTTPNALLDLIFRFSQPKTVLTSFRVCSRWSELNGHLALWRTIYINELCISPRADQPLISLQTEVRLSFKLIVKYRNQAKTPVYQTAVRFFGSGSFAFVCTNSHNQFISVNEFGVLERWDFSYKNKPCIKLFDFSDSFGTIQIIRKIQLFQNMLLIYWDNAVTQCWNWNRNNTMPTLTATLPKTEEVSAWDCCSADDALISLREGNNFNIYTWNLQKNTLSSSPIISERQEITFMKQDGGRLFYTIEGVLKRCLFPAKDITVTTLAIPNLQNAENIMLERGYLSFIGRPFRGLEIWDCNSNKRVINHLRVQDYTRFQHFYFYQGSDSQNSLEIRRINSELKRSLKFETNDPSEVQIARVCSHLHCTSTGEIFLLQNISKVTGAFLDALHKWDFSETQ